MKEEEEKHASIWDVRIDKSKYGLSVNIRELTVFLSFVVSYFALSIIDELVLGGDTWVTANLRWYGLAILIGGLIFGYFRVGNRRHYLYTIGVALLFFAIVFAVYFFLV